MKTFVIVLLPLLIASWIGGVISDFNVLMVIHWNGRPFDHYSSFGIVVFGLECT